MNPRNVLVVLEKAVEEQEGVAFERSSIHGFPAARTVHTGGGQAADITLIGFRRDVLAIVGQSSERAAKSFEPIFGETARSCRALRSSERSGIRESRLRVRTAHSGETAADLVKRSGATWSAAELAAANAIDLDTALAAGRALKVAIPEGYSR